MNFDIRRFDIYRKIPKDLTQPTNTGGTISLLCIFFIVYLLLAEFYSFIVPQMTSQLFVQNFIENHTDSRIPVYLDISVWGTDCKYLGVDIQDDLGRHEVGHVQDLTKKILTDTKRKTKIHYENDEEDEEYHGKTGCRMNVFFRVNRVPGNFHVSTHASREKPVGNDMSHTIHTLIFGDSHENFTQIADSSFEALDNITSESSERINSHDYLMKIVPTIHVTVANETSYPFQYTYVHREFNPARQGYMVNPSIWFRYELNPITVKYKEIRPPLYHFLTTICAIIGGTFTVAGIVDSFLFSATQAFKKFQMGKLG